MRVVYVHGSVVEREERQYDAVWVEPMQSIANASLLDVRERIWAGVLGSFYRMIIRADGLC
jgi:hypothetical protein